jgi:hypothetical protein
MRWMLVSMVFKILCDFIMLKASVAIRTLLVCSFTAITPVSAAIFDVTNSYWGDSTSAGSFAWAIHQANITPGHDTIGLLTNVSIDIASPLTPFRLADITDPAGLLIQGNGHSLTGNPSFITPSGVVVTKTNPQAFRSGDVQIAPTYSFAKVDDNVSDVVIRNLNVDGLNSFLNIGKGSTVTVENSIFSHMGDFGQRPAPVFEAFDDSILNLKRVALNHINNFQRPIVGSEYIWFPVIAGVNSTLNMVNSTLDTFVSSTAGAMTWDGGTANIVSSVILGQGLSVIDYTKEGVLNLVNSVFRPYDHSATARIQAYNGGVANLIASTIQFDGSGTLDVPIDSSHPLLGCPNNYKCSGAPLQAFNQGVINLASTAVSVINTDLFRVDHPYSATYKGTVGALTADGLTFVQPVANQDSAALMSLFRQPSLLTSGMPYQLNTTFLVPHYLRWPAGADPLVTGPLLNVVPDADGGINQLINPIDGSAITSDVFGNPRTSNGLRDVGAVQHSVPGPLPLLGVGSAFGWSRRLRRRLGKRSYLHQSATSITNS